MIVTPKINIGLSVLGKRPDGFHALETLFYPVDAFSDKLNIETVPGPCGQVQMDVRYENGKHVDWDQTNDLCAKAYRMLVAEGYGLPSVKITLVKGIPVGAGLGGGSADAVATLKLLSKMFFLNLSAAKLKSFAARLGSDCAFFVDYTPSMASGRGEVLEPFALDLSGYTIRVELPAGEKVATADAYRKIDHYSEPGALAAALSRPIEEWKDCLFNDFESSVFETHPAIAALKEEMYARGAVYASMTGSGAAVFGIFKK